MTICKREKLLSFFDLQSVLLVEDNHTGASKSAHTDSKMLYTEVERFRGCGGCGRSAHNGDGQYD